METPIDLLQVKIEQAKDNLPPETKKAIDSVDWRTFILGLREKKGFSFEQLEDLDLLTELLLCGLLKPTDYPKEIETRLGITKSQVDLLVNEMNEAIFVKIREELIKNTEKKELFENKDSSTEKNSIPKENTEIKIPEVKTPEPKKEDPIFKRPSQPIPIQKLVGSFQMPAKKTEYSLNIPKKDEDSKKTNLTEKTEVSGVDPYRMNPNE